jgi:hypothetical protein
MEIDTLPRTIVFRLQLFFMLFIELEFFFLEILPFSSVFVLFHCSDAFNLLYCTSSNREKNLNAFECRNFDTEREVHDEPLMA